MLYLGYTGSSIITYQLNKNSNKFYTWRIIDKDSNVEQEFYVPDFSTSPYYISSTISIPTDISILNYQYTFEIYEVLFSTASYTTGLKVKEGIITIDGTYSQTITYTDLNNTTTNVYRNQDRI